MPNTRSEQPFRRLLGSRLVIALALPLTLFAILLWGSAGVVAREYAAATLFVDGATGNDAGSCQGPGTPCQTIEYAIAQAVDGDTVLIAGGTYTENLVIAGKALTLRGGYSFAGTAWLPATAETIVNGNNADRVFLVRGGSDVLLENLTITGGSAPEEQCWGGGVSVTDGDLTVRSSIIRDNEANCSSGMSGGGAGGGLDVNNDEGPAVLIVEDSIVAGNFAKDHGAALNTWRSTAHLSNVLVTGNSQHVLAVNETEFTLLNSTVADNSLDGNALLDFASPATITVQNSIVWNSGAISCGTGGGTCSVTYSDIEGGWQGDGNINQDPVFAGGGSYRLQLDSPCIDTATNSGAPDHDIEQNARPLDGDGDGTAVTDMGAYEFRLQKIFLPLTVKSPGL